MDNYLIVSVSSTDEINLSSIHCKTKLEALKLHVQKYFSWLEYDENYKKIISNNDNRAFKDILSYLFRQNILMEVKLFNDIPVINSRCGD